MKISRDLFAGILLLTLGIAIAIYTQMNYRMGTLRSMGPGYMPFALATLLAMLGFITALVSQLGAKPQNEDSERPFELRKFICITLAVLVFALTVTKLGLLVATTLLVAIASFADNRFNLKLTVILAASLCIIASVVFVYFLSMTIPLLWW